MTPFEKLSLTNSSKDFILIVGNETNICNWRWRIRHL